MVITLTADQEAFIRQAVDAGRIGRAEDAITEPLLLWEERERQRADLIASLDEARASIDSGEGIDITRESMRDLAEDVKRRGRQRFAAERQSPG